MPEIQAPAAGQVTQEGVGSVRADGGTPTYEQITEQLKRDTPAETPEPETVETPAPTAKATAPATEEEAVEDLRTMTDEEIAQLAPELQQEAKALRKRFQAAYTKKTMNLAEIRRKADILDRFDSDPEFQQQVIQAVQQKRGGPAPQASPTALQPQQPNGVPPALVEMAKKSLPPEMQWMADSQAAFGWQLVQAMQQHLIQPLQQAQTQAQQERVNQEYQTALSGFAERNPGWEAHEDDMVEVLEFLKSPKLNHPRWGSKHDLLFRLAQGDKAEARAVVGALEKTAEAVKHRSVVSKTAGRGTTSNLEDRIRDRKISDNEAWQLIKEAAPKL